MELEEEEKVGVVVATVAQVGPPHPLLQEQTPTPLVALALGHVGTPLFPLQPFEAIPHAKVLAAGDSILHAPVVG